MSSDPDPSPRSPSRAAERPPAGRSAPADVQLHNPSRYPEVRARPLRRWLEALLDEAAPGSGGLGVRFVSDREMQALNHRFCGRDRTTDVLSFPGEADGEEAYLGDVAISVPAARRQAAEAGHGVEKELRILLLHGVLHCLGHDHETDDGAMESLEAQLRRRWTDG